MTKAPPQLALLLASDAGYIGGVARVMLTLANEMVKTGERIELVTTNAGGVRPDDLDPRVGVHDLGARGLRDAVVPLIRYFRDRRPAVMLSAMEHPNLIAVIARLLGRAQTRLVLSTHGSLDQRLAFLWKFRERTMIRLLVRALYPRADGVVAVSEGVAGELRRLAPGARDRIRTIYNPIAVLPEAGTPPDLPPGDGPLIISAGRFSVQKSYPLLLDAFAIAGRQRPMRLALVGDGEDKPALEARARALGIAGRVSFPGWSKALAAWMRAADLFVLSSRWEGFGNVIVEAMACGCPVVSTDCPYGPAEILDGGRYGRLVEVGNADALAAAIVASLEETHDRDALRARAAEFSVERCVAAYRDVLGLPGARHLKTLRG